MQLSSLMRSSRGDTIVEVLIVIALISSAVGSAYAIANRGVKSNQQAQEHARALGVAEGQIEQLKTAIKTGAAAGGSPLSSDTFCMYIDSSSQNAIKTFSGTFPSTNNEDYPAECRKPDEAVAERYMTVIKRQGDAAAGYTFTAHVNWDGPTGIRDSVVIRYKAYL